MHPVLLGHQYYLCANVFAAAAAADGAVCSISSSGNRSTTHGLHLLLSPLYQHLPQSHSLICHLTQ
jgi:hypothetical protein